jgi:hypothetical protein
MEKSSLFCFCFNNIIFFREIQHKAAGAVEILVSNGARTEQAQLIGA